MSVMDIRFIGRFTGSAVMASVIVFVLLLVSLWMFGAYKPEKSYRALSVELLSRIDLAELLGEEPRRELPTLPQMQDIEPLVIPERSQAGFVQVEFSVDDRGRVTEAEVINATPEGIFEEQALAIVRSKRYQPDPGTGASDRRTEIVDFSVAPSPAPDAE